MPYSHTGKNTDPQFRHERARKAAEARLSPDRLIARLAALAPTLTAAQAAQVHSLVTLLPSEGGDRS